MAPVATAYLGRKRRTRGPVPRARRPEAIEKDKPKAALAPAITSWNDDPPVSVQPPTPANSNVCPHCGNATLCYALHKSRCTSCGFTQVRHVVFKGAMAYSERIGIVAGNYRRYIHFRDIMRKRTKGGFTGF